MKVKDVLEVANRNISCAVVNRSGGFVANLPETLKDQLSPNMLSAAVIGLNCISSAGRPVLEIYI